MVKVNISGVYAKTHTSKRTGVVRTYYYHRATGVRLPDNPLSPEFDAHLRQLKGAPARPTRLVPAERTLGHLIRNYKASDGYLKLRSTTRSEYDRHMRYLEMLRDMPVTGFAKLHGDQIKAKYTEKNKPVLGEAVVRTLSVLLSYAVSPLGWIAVNPLFGPSQGDKRRRSEVGQRPYEEHEIATFRLKNPLGSRARLAFELDLSTGLRMEDLPAVPREAVLSGSIAIITKKNRVLVVAPVTEMARAALLAWEDTRRTNLGADFEPSRYALCTLAGQKIGKRRISDELSKAYVRAGFDDGQRTHALRYTAAARLFELGFHFDDIAELIGHAGAEMTRKYLIKKRRARLVKPLLDAIGPSAIAPVKPANAINPAEPLGLAVVSGASAAGKDMTPLRDEKAAKHNLKNPGRGERAINVRKRPNAGTRQGSPQPNLSPPK